MKINSLILLFFLLVLPLTVAEEEEGKTILELISCYNFSVHTLNDAMWPMFLMTAFVVPITQHLVAEREREEKSIKPQT